MSAYLSKLIPARRETVHFVWIVRDFQPMSAAWRKARMAANRKADRCFWCRHEFEEGESIGLAGIEGKTNKLICNTCTDEALNNGKQP